MSQHLQSSDSAEPAPKKPAPQLGKPQTLIRGTATLRPVHASELLGVHPMTLLRWEKQFTDFPKPSRPTSRATLYDKQKLLDWVRSREGVPA